MSSKVTTPDGYKDSALGVIPEDWEVKRLGEVAKIFVGKDLKESNYSEVKSDKYTHKVYSNTVQDKGLYGYYDFEEYKGKAITVVGRGVGLGTAFPRHEGFGAIGRLLVIYPRNHDYRLRSEYINNKVQIFVESAAIPQLTGEQFATYKIAIPNIAEQKRIAEVLEHWDKAIEKQSKIIDLLERRKRALMQRLLTGKVRLSGFNGAWKKVKLGEISDIKTGSKNNEDKIENGKYPFFVRSQKVETIDTYSYDGEAILIPGEGKIGEVIHYINGKFDYHQRVYKISNFSNSFPLFIFYYLQYNFAKQAINNSVKACVDSLRLPVFIEMIVNLPILEEQQAIAEVLSTADNEIKMAKQKFEAIHTQKRALMQQLLTGKKRLKI